MKKPRRGSVHYSSRTYRVKFSSRARQAQGRRGRGGGWKKIKETEHSKNGIDSEHPHSGPSTTPHFRFRHSRLPFNSLSSKKNKTNREADLAHLHICKTCTGYATVNKISQIYMIKRTFLVRRGDREYDGEDQFDLLCPPSLTREVNSSAVSFLFLLLHCEYKYKRMIELQKLYTSERQKLQKWMASFGQCQDNNRRFFC